MVSVGSVRTYGWCLYLVFGERRVRDGLGGNRTRGLCDASAAICQLIYEPGLMTRECFIIFKLIAFYAVQEVHITYKAWLSNNT